MDKTEECENKFPSSKIEEDDDERFLEADERNFHRDFTLRFRMADRPDQTLKAPERTKAQEIFADETVSPPRPELAFKTSQINLNCFIYMLEFQMELIEMIRRVVFASEWPSNSRPAVDGGMRIKLRLQLLKCLNRSYLASIELEHLLSFKTLLTKMYYLSNVENQMANFLHLTKPCFLAISDIFLPCKCSKDQRVEPEVIFCFIIFLV